MVTSWEQRQAGKEGLDLLLLPALGRAGNSVAASLLYKPLLVEAALLNVFAAKINRLIGSHSID